MARNGLAFPQPPEPPAPFLTTTHNTMTRSILFLTAFFFIFAPTQAQDCERETDRYSGDTTINCEPRTLDVLQQPSDVIQNGNVAVAALPGEQDLYLLVTVYAESWNFLRTDEAYFLADGSRYRARAVRSPESEVSEGNVIEQVVVVIPKRDAEKLADASSIEVKLATAVFDVSVVAPGLQGALELR